MTTTSTIFGAWRGFLLLPLFMALAWFALSPARAVTPEPDGGYPNQNTAEGTGALFSLTTGCCNTALGFRALFFTTIGSFNTATDRFALFSNTSGPANTATGVAALHDNTTGENNTANGAFALAHNTAGGGNTAIGREALNSNTTGGGNTANGKDALHNNTSGCCNTATGLNALFFNTTGSGNIALGRDAGRNLTTGNNNIDIGNPGVAGESNIMRIGSVRFQQATFIAGIRGSVVPGGVGVVAGPNGQLGTVISSARFKDQIKPMDRASEAILALKPVTFRYKRELDPAGIPQFGLVAEQVAKVNPDLVARDHQGKVLTVRYEAVNAMLLNEFLKEHRRHREFLERNSRRMQELEAAIAQQQKEIKALAANLVAAQPKAVVRRPPALGPSSRLPRLKEQTLQIRKVRAASLR